MFQGDVLQSELSPFAPEIRQDPYPRYHALREAAPVASGPPGLWVLTRYWDCELVLKDRRFGHLEAGEEPANPMFGRLGDDGEPLHEPDGKPVHSFIVLNPPEHTRIRRLVSQAFTVKSIRRLEPRIAEIADELIEAAAAASRFDMLSEIAYPLTVRVISEVLGVPSEDYPVFRDWANDIGRGLDPVLGQDEEVIRRLGAARRGFSEYFLELAQRRAANPQQDLLSAMVTARHGSDRLTDVELVVTCTLLLGAGYETTANLIGNSVLALLRHPRELDRLRDAGKVTQTTVDEFLRYDTPGQLAARVAREDVHIDGMVIPRGDSVLALLGAANRDPAVFPEPDRLDLERDGAGHLSFGHGIHLCLGAFLARTQARLLLERLFAQVSDLTLISSPRWKENIALRGLEELHVEAR